MDVCLQFQLTTFLILKAYTKALWAVPVQKYTSEIMNPFRYSVWLLRWGISMLLRIYHQRQQNTERSGQSRS